MADRLEELLPDALRRHSGGDGGVAGLAAGARARATRRGRRRTAGTVVAVALAVAAVPTAIALTGSSPSVGPAPSPPTTSDAGPTPTGVRVESWRNLTVTVPSEWGYGGGPDWCIVDTTSPGISRPENGARGIVCFPRASYGLHFIDSAAISWARESGDVWQYGWDSPDQVKMYPEDAWLGHFRVGDHALMVVTPDEATTRAVLDSAREVTGTDPNGCSPRESSHEPLGVGERWSVCRYTGSGWLVQSELLSEADSRVFADAVAAAPFAGRGPMCADVGPPPGFVLAGSGADLGTVRIVFESWCVSQNAVTLSGIQRELTEDILYWAISPGWSGGVDGSVPLPDPFRTR